MKSYRKDAPGNQSQAHLQKEKHTTHFNTTSCIRRLALWSCVGKAMIFKLIGISLTPSKEYHIKSRVMRCLNRLRRML